MLADRIVWLAAKLALLSGQEYQGCARSTIVKAAHTYAQQYGDGDADLAYILEDAFSYSAFHALCSSETKSIRPELPVAA